VQALLASSKLRGRSMTVDRGTAFLARFPHLVEHIVLHTRPGDKGRTLLAALNEGRLRRVLHRMLDEEEFLSPFGIRS
jgi:hypothetical protein